MTLSPRARDLLFQGERAPRVLPAVEHLAGNEKFMLKALALQREMGPVFDITFDLEDGAPVGNETVHASTGAALIASSENRHHMAGARIHDATHPHWRDDVEILLRKCGAVLRYLTIPKVRSAGDVRLVRDFVERRRRAHGIAREIPLHVLIETHGALRDIWSIAALPGVEVLDFGLLDFISEHHGAIPESCMQSPGQFEHALIRRAKCEIVSAAIAHGVVPAHNITIDLSSPDRASADARRARAEFGFLRMWSIHPSQIAAILEGMSPSAAELQAAGEILRLAEAANWGPIRYQDRLYDRASFRYYAALLERAQTRDR